MSDDNEFKHIILKEVLKIFHDEKMECDLYLAKIAGIRGGKYTWTIGSNARRGETNEVQWSVDIQLDKGRYYINLNHEDRIYLEDPECLDIVRKWCKKFQIFYLEEIQLITASNKHATFKIWDGRMERIRDWKEKQYVVEDLPELYLEDIGA